MPSSCCNSHAKVVGDITKTLGGMTCPYCNKTAEWVSNDVIYGKRYGRSYMAYFCKDCNAYVGCHNNSRKPLGTMANKELRDHRMRVHALLDPLWKTHKYKRDTVYKRLSESFGFVIHIGEADESLCKEIMKMIPILFTRI